MIKITLKDGSVREAAKGTTIREFAKGLSHKLAKEAIVGKVNDGIQGMDYPLEEDCRLEILTFDDEEAKKTFWHTSSHIMANAIMRLFPEAKFGIGPAIANGFYYDIDLEHRLTEDDLERLEKEMKAICEADEPLVRFEKPRAEAL